jgi:hypothetical protein
MAQNGAKMAQNGAKMAFRYPVKGSRQTLQI